ncbi:hypothetical protein FRB99_004856 [Tulasnella sp. 403]|nr:hypothetical protein FRB99_004856 [Tulasnella sp. 403]
MPLNGPSQAEGKTRLALHVGRGGKYPHSPIEIPNVNHAQLPLGSTDDEGKVNKILRRGRKIQELESIYGQFAPAIRTSSSLASSSSQAPPCLPVKRHGTESGSFFKQLTMEFFSSEFYRRWNLQFPIVDPNEFSERYEKYLTKHTPLGPCGELIAAALYAWATSFGYDESGNPLPTTTTDASGGVGYSFSYPTADSDAERIRKDRRRETNALVEELLEAIDYNSIARTMSWDGVRVLLLVLPLTADVLSEVDRANLYQTTLLQVYALSGVGGGYETPVLPPMTGGGPVPEVVRARIFWYAHVHEGITSGLNGGKLIFDQGDITSFRTSLGSTSYTTSLSSHPSTAGLTHHSIMAPFRLAATCRLISDVLTSPKAERTHAETASSVNELEVNLPRIWAALEKCWEEFEHLKKIPTQMDKHRRDEEGLKRAESLTDMFVSMWQIYIFEVYNVVREKLWSRIQRQRDCTPSSDPMISAGVGLPGSLPIPSTTGSSASDRATYNPLHLPHSSTVAKSRLRDLMQLHDLAENKCDKLAPSVINIIRHHISPQRSMADDAMDGILGLREDSASTFTSTTIDNDDIPLFELDARFTQRGILYAAVWTITERSLLEELQLCLTALGQMRWAYASHMATDEEINKLTATLHQYLRHDLRVNTNLATLHFDSSLPFSVPGNLPMALNTSMVPLDSVWEPATHAGATNAYGNSNAIPSPNGSETCEAGVELVGGSSRPRSTSQQNSFPRSSKTGSNDRRSTSLSASPISIHTPDSISLPAFEQLVEVPMSGVDGVNVHVAEPELPGADFLYEEFFSMTPGMPASVLPSVGQIDPTPETHSNRSSPQTHLGDDGPHGTVDPKTSPTPLGAPLASSPPAFAHHTSTTSEAYDPSVYSLASHPPPDPSSFMSLFADLRTTTRFDPVLAIAEHVPTDHLGLFGSSGTHAPLPDLSATSFSLKPNPYPRGGYTHLGLGPASSSALTASAMLEYIRSTAATPMMQALGGEAGLMDRSSSSPSSASSSASRTPVPTFFTSV